jgi:predicted NBD/HSP70 family sugar kinase
MVVNPTGALCRCGSIGCWETVIGRDAVLISAGRSPDSSDIGDMVLAAHAGSQRDREALDEAGEWLGLGLANLVNLLSPEVVVLGGHLRQLFPEVREIVMDRVRNALAPRGATMRVVLPAFDGDSTLVGAAESALAPVLADPLGAVERSGILIAS